MERDQENKGYKPDDGAEEDVSRCFEEDQGATGSGSCEASASNKDPENKADSTNEYIRLILGNPFEDDGNPFEDDKSFIDFVRNLDKRWEDKKEDDKETDHERKRINPLEILKMPRLKTGFSHRDPKFCFKCSLDGSEEGCKAKLGAKNVADAEREPFAFVFPELLPICGKSQDALGRRNSKEACEAELGAENVAVSEREPIVFGLLSEFLPICVVTLDFRSSGSPCYDVRELLKEKLWTQSPQMVDQLTMLRDFFKLRDTSLQLIECRGAIQLYVQVYTLNDIYKITNDVQSRGFSDILTRMFLSGNIKAEMEKLNAQLSVTCHCESLEQWRRELKYEGPREVLSFFKPATGSSLNTLHINWPSSSSFNSGSSEESGVSKATVGNHWISQDSEWAESSVSVGQRITDDGKPESVSHPTGVAQNQYCSRGQMLRGRGRGHIPRGRGLGRGQGRGRGRNLTSEVGAEASLPYL